MVEIDKRDMRRRLEKIEQLLGQIEGVADPGARACAVEMVESLMELHGAGIERMLEIIFEGGAPGGRALIERLAADELVAGLMLLYGLHPLDLETRIRQALEKVRPHLRSHGGNVELLGVEAGVVRLRLDGSCNGCASSAMTLEMAIEEAIYEAAPEVTSLEVEGVVAAAPPSSSPSTLSSSGSPSGSPSGLVQLQRSAASATPFSDKRSGGRKDAESCELCGAELGAAHEHLVEPASRRLLCACTPCAILFHNKNNDHNNHNRGQAVKYRRVPRDLRFLPDFRLTDAQWESLSIPISMAFFFESTPAGRIVALYPSPAGATESLLALEAWKEIAEQNPILEEMEADTEALLVNRMGERSGGKAEYYLAPIDECYRLTGLIRARWRGLGGGAEVWEEIARFFAELKQRAMVTRAAASG